MVANRMAKVLLVLLCVGFVLSAASEMAQASKTPVIVPASAWSLAGTWKVPGGKGNGTGNCQFGPRTGITAGNYQAYLSDGVDPFTVYGSFIMKKSKLKSMSVNTGNLQSALNAIFKPYGVTVARVVSAKMKGKPKKASKKKPQMLKLQFKVKFVVTAQGRYKTVTMKWKMEGPRS